MQGEDRCSGEQFGRIRRTLTRTLMEGRLPNPDPGPARTPGACGEALNVCPPCYLPRQCERGRVNASMEIAVPVAAPAVAPEAWGQESPQARLARISAFNGPPARALRQGPAFGCMVRKSAGFSVLLTFRIRSPKSSVAKPYKKNGFPRSTASTSQLRIRGGCCRQAFGSAWWLPPLPLQGRQCGSPWNARSPSSRPSLSPRARRAPSPRHGRLRREREPARNLGEIAKISPAPRRTPNRTSAATPCGAPAPL